jgi:FKBP-type peptidyl-prolyl cis-trans isomerase SlpA
MEACLVGLTEGTRRSFVLAAGEAFGQRNPQMLQRVRRSMLDELGDPQEDYHVGDVVQFQTPDGRGRYAGVVRQLDGDVLVFDFNHPLAGHPVTFEVQLIGVL